MHGGSIGVGIGGGAGPMTDERLISLVIDILSVHGAVPVGKLGSLLHKAANDHTLPQMLKERYGGLKKFLQSQTAYFTLGTDHPYNPSLSLSAEFLAANPHIRPPEPATAAALSGSGSNQAPSLPSTAPPSVSPSPAPHASGSTTPSIDYRTATAPSTSDYHQYFTNTSSSSLLSPLSLNSAVSGSSASLVSREHSAPSASRYHSSPLCHSSSSSTLSAASSAAVAPALGSGMNDHASSSWDASSTSSSMSHRPIGVSGLLRDTDSDVHVPDEDDIVAPPLIAERLRDDHDHDDLTHHDAGRQSSHSSHTSHSSNMAGGTSSSVSVDDEAMKVLHSPSLGATDASATANANFFSRLLG